MRRHSCTRAELDRTFVSARTRWGEVPVKVGSLEDGTVVNVHPEYDTVAALAVEHSVPAMAVAEEAIRLARAELGGGGSAGAAGA